MSVPVRAVACQDGAMRLRAHLPLLAAVFGTLTTPASAWTILTVGPAGQYHSISEAVAAADADTNLSHLFEVHVEGRWVR
jgi:hypothetical protein